EVRATSERDGRLRPSSAEETGALRGAVRRPHPVAVLRVPGRKEERLASARRRWRDDDEAGSRRVVESGEALRPGVDSGPRGGQDRERRGECGYRKASDRKQRDPHGQFTRTGRRISRPLLGDALWSGVRRILGRDDGDRARRRWPEVVGQYAL